MEQGGVGEGRWSKETRVFLFIIFFKSNALIISYSNVFKTEMKKEQGL